MSGRKNHIDKIFNRKLRHHGQEPPSDVWDHIREELDLGRERKRFAWIIPAAASVAVVAVLSLSYLLIRDTDKNKLVTERQISADSVIEEKEQSIPVYVDQRDREEEIAEAEIAKEKEIMSEEHVMLAEMDVPVDKIIGDNDMSVKFEGITDLSRPEAGLKYLKMNYLSRLDFDVYHREIKPVRSYDRPVYEYPAESELGELYVYDLPPDENDVDNKWAIGSRVSPLFSYRNLSAKGSALKSNSYYDQIESGLVAYAGGVNVNYLPTTRFSIQSGIYYSKLGLSVGYDYYYENLAPAEITSASVYKFNSVSNSSGIINVENNSQVDYTTNSDDSWERTSYFGGISELNVRVFEGDIIQNFEYLEIPMILRYKLIDRKLDFNFLGGMSTNFLIGSNVYYQEGGTREKVGKTTDIKTVNYSSIFGFGIDYAISKRLNVNLEPTFRYYINSINLSSSISSHPYSMGIFTGMTFYF